MKPNCETGRCVLALRVESSFFRFKQEDCSLGVTWAQRACAGLSRGWTYGFAHQRPGISFYIDDAPLALIFRASIGAGLQDFLPGK